MDLQRSALWVVALTAVALTLPSAARADHGTSLLDDRLGTYFGIAQAHWGGPIPSCVANGVATVPVHAVLYDDPDPSVAARADQPGCRLWLDRTTWRTMGPVGVCTVVVHEWGHLIGLGHSDKPLALMAEFPGRTPRRCAALGTRARIGRASARRRNSCGAVRARRVRRLPLARTRRISRVCIRRTRS